MNEELRIHVDECINGYGGGAVLLPRNPRHNTLVVKQAEREIEKILPRRETPNSNNSKDIAVQTQSAHTHPQTWSQAGESQRTGARKSISDHKKKVTQDHAGSGASYIQKQKSQGVT
jgi:hypothetical protein